MTLLNFFQYFFIILILTGPLFIIIAIAIEQHKFIADWKISHREDRTGIVASTELLRKSNEQFQKFLTQRKYNI